MLSGLITGRWDESLAIADDFIAAGEAGSPHYMECAARNHRAAILLARDRENGIDRVDHPFDTLCDAHVGVGLTAEDTARRAGATQPPCHADALDLFDVLKDLLAIGAEAEGVGTVIELEFVNDPAAARRENGGVENPVLLRRTEVVR